MGNAHDYDEGATWKNCKRGRGNISVYRVGINNESIKLKKPKTKKIGSMIMIKITCYLSKEYYYEKSFEESDCYSSRALRLRRHKARKFIKSFESLEQFVQYAVNTPLHMYFPELDKELTPEQLRVVNFKFSAHRRNQLRNKYLHWAF